VISTLVKALLQIPISSILPSRFSCKSSPTPELPIPLPNTLNVEVASFQDVEELVKLSKLCYSAQYPKRKRINEFFQDHVEEKVRQSEFHIIRTQGEISSFCEVDLQGPDVLIISNIYTSNKYRSQGFSSALVNNILCNFLSNDSKIAAMKINISNEQSHSVARRNGFTKIITNSFGILNPTENSDQFLEIATV